MASTKPVDVVIPKNRLVEIKQALEVLDNPLSGGDDPKERPRKYKYKSAAITRYDLASNFKVVFDEFRIVDKVRKDIVRIHLDEQLKAHPELDQLTGKWNQIAVKEIEAMGEESVTLRLRQIPIDALDLENNSIPFTAIAILMGNVIVDSETKDDELVDD